MEGQDLIRFLIESTGLPTEIVENELHQILQKRGVRSETLTVEEVRQVLSDYLLDVLTDAKNSTTL